MKNIEFWQPTKFLLEKNKPKAYGKNIYPGSYIIISILAGVYYDQIKHYATGRLLDLGCGNVPLYCFYKDKIDEVICIDWENSMHKNQFVDYQFNLNLPFPIDIGKFDTILSTDVLEHIQEPDIFFSQISDSLKINGKLILSTPFLYWIHEPPFDFNRYTEYKLSALCDKYNLRIIELKPYGGLFEVFADLISKALSEKKFWIRVFNKIVSPLLKLKIIKRNSDKYAKLFPIGYILIAEKVG